MAAAAIPVATATADPLLDPPGIRSIPPRVGRRPKMRVHSRSTVGKLVQIGLADDHGASDPEAPRQLAVAVARAGRPAPRTGGRHRAFHVAEVLERDGYSVKRAPVNPARDLRFDCPRLLESASSNTSVNVLSNPRRASMRSSAALVTSTGDTSFEAISRESRLIGR